MNVKAVLTLLSIVAATASAITPSQAQGFAGPGAEAEGFARVAPGRPLAFPADHGAHPDFRIEWWYFTAVLEGADGERYGAQWTLFRQAMRPGIADEGFASQQLWMGHAAVTSASVHRFAEKFARGGVGQAGVDAAPFKAWIDNWQMKSVSSDVNALAPLELTATATDFSYTLRLDSDRQVVLQGDAGYSRKSERGHASYYYSQPYLRVSGSISLDGKAIAVTGQGWIDREWSSQALDADQKGWDWFSLHLASGEKLMLFRLRQNGGDHYLAGNWIGLDGRSEPLDGKAMFVTPTEVTRVAGRELPTAWKISIPARKLEIAAAPLNPRSWMDTRFKYWEGPITVSGSHAGQGYLEMTGY